ncbi:MAG: sulfotransferase [Terricaulis sp.]
MNGRANAPLNEAKQQLADAPARAEASCREALRLEPSNIEAQILLMEALRRQAKLIEARALAVPFAAAHPALFGAQRMLGVVLGDSGEHAAAAEALRNAAVLMPDHPFVWRELGDTLRAAGDLPAAQNAYLQHARSSSADPRVAEAANLVRSGQEARGKAQLEAFVVRFPTDVTALVALGEANARLNDTESAEALLRRALELAPQFGYARQSLTQLLLGLGRYEDALREAEALVAGNPQALPPKRWLATALAALGEFDRAIEIFEALLAADPNQAGVWVDYGHALKTVGRADEGAIAYKRALAIAPRLGDGYWSLANLKTWRFTDADIAQMEAQLRLPDLPSSDRVNILYALGRAHEQRRQSEQAFARYNEGARLYRRSVSYDPALFSNAVDRSIALFTPEFFADRVGAGDQRADPIFVVGLPRAGSTLVEQILTSHSMVESTMELADITQLARAIESGGDYLAAIAALDHNALAGLGARYLASTQIYRKLDRPHFIDKMPNNFAHTGLIHLMLPNAKIIDVRRHPLACGWSCFKQHWAMGQLFTYDLRELGLYYRDYVRLMSHYDAVLPGRVHRVIYEDLVSNPEAEIRRLIAYCGLAFEDQVLRPHENDRAVRTPSAEQVRQPISAKGLDDWREFEGRLAPLKEALGDVLSNYPKAP